MCEEYDFEGACCANIRVSRVDVFSKAGESKEQEFLRCFNIDDIFKAFDNEDFLVDDSTGGTNNTYKFKCTEPVSSLLGAKSGI